MTQSKIDPMIQPGEVEFLPLLRDLGKMLSRRMLAEYGVEDWMIEAAERRGEVVVSGPGPLASIILTDVGEATMMVRKSSTPHE